jgi:hypothetical protein
MMLSVTTDEGDLYNLEIDSQMEIENLKALLEAEVSILTKVVMICQPRLYCQRNLGHCSGH